jgi:hypothetical protein
MCRRQEPAMKLFSRVNSLLRRADRLLPRSRARLLNGVGALLLSCVAAPILLAGCAGSGEGLDENVRPIEPGGGGELTPDFASIQTHVFTPICTQCHVGANAPQGLRLDAASSYDALVGVASSEVPSLLRVEPGNPGRSYLVQKLEGRAAVGDRMPAGQPPLPDETVLVIRQWIADGALRGSSADEDRFAVRAVSWSAAQVAVGLTRPVDASLVNATTVSLLRIDAEALRAPVPQVRVSVSPHNDALLIVEPQSVLEPGVYRLVLRGNGAAALADWNAVVLDGDEDGRPGGDFVGMHEVGSAP